MTLKQPPKKTLQEILPHYENPDDILHFDVLCCNFFEWLELCNSWMQTSSVALVMYYTMAQEKHHPLVLKGQRTQCRHYSVFEVMQYEPQSATFSSKKYIYYHGWLLRAEMIKWKVVLCIFRWLYVYCKLTEGCLKLYSVYCPRRGTVWQFHFLYFMFRLWYDKSLSMMNLGC